MPYSSPANPIALLPLLLFLVIFVGSGLYFSWQGSDYAFYQVSPNIAILPAIALALFISTGPFKKRFASFIDGVRDPNILIMCFIYLLAGAFSAVTQSIGGIKETVNLGLSLFPPSFLLPGLFLIAAFMATAMGTSMGVIATVAPLAAAISTQTGLDMTWCMGAIVGGAMFGDNLSLVSDTTIASVNTQEANLRKKFTLNIFFAVPAMLCTTVILYIVTPPLHDFAVQSYDWIKIAPYLFVFALALTGLNVLIVLGLGIILSGCIGLMQLPDYSIVLFTNSIAKGFASMQEILILSLLIGGLSYLTNKQGGLDYLIQKIEKFALTIRKKDVSQRIGEMSISVISSIADICTANNTVAILVSGKMAKKLSNKHGVTPERSACLIDIFTCVFQGLLPYSAQILLASSISGISPLTLITHVIYCPILGAISIAFIVMKRPRSS